MEQGEDNQVKISFRFFNELLEQDIIEIMFADIVDENLGYFKIDSIPVYTLNIAPGDIVNAEFDENAEMLVYRETIKPSGNSIVWVVIVDDEKEITDIQDIFYELDCATASTSDRFFSMEIKVATNYLRIKNKLNELKSEGVIDFAEACISELHRY